MRHGSFFDQFDAWFTVTVLVAALTLAWGLGWWIGRRGKREGEPPAEKLGEASFGLLALLLAFTVGMALQKHDGRRKMVVAESTAIGDFYTCADLLREPLRDKLTAEIRDYARLLIQARDDVRGPDIERDRKRAAKEIHRMTDLVREAADSGSPVTVPLTNTLNELTTAQEARLSAFEDRIPTAVMFLLFLAAIASTGLTGWRHGAVGTPQRLGPALVIVLLTLVIYVILDLDQPTRGLIRVNQAPMARLVASMN